MADNTGNVIGGRLGRGRMGQHENTTRDRRTNGTVGDLITEQQSTNDLLKSIDDGIKNLGGNSGALGSILRNNSDSPGGAIDVAAIGRAASEGVGNSDTFRGMSNNIASVAASSETNTESMKSMSGSMSGGMIALQVINKVLEAIRSTLGMINDTVQGGIDQSIANQKQYLGPISARLQSFTDDSVTAYKEISFNIRDIFTNSRYINQQEMLQNISRLVETGVGYNLEDRAYLETIADRTVKTFDVLDASLNRMIRLQQSDLTRSQMGLEAYLTKGLNAMFEDTSYLNSMYDTVTSALMEATSQMSYEETTGYLYNVQKWLGSLYSVGMSESAIQTIAQGLNYLGSGNVSQLTGNDQLNTLFAMAAQRAGLSYAQLLTTGVSDENVDKLLRSMIEYLQSIAENTSSEVLRSEYGRVFGGLSVSDLRAIQNLTTTDLDYIDAYKLSYQGAFEETAKQISTLTERTSVAEQVSNMFNNMIYSLGAQIAEDEDSYMTWVKASIIEELGDTVGGVIPGIIGNIFANAIGAGSEAVKTSQIVKAITTTGGGLTMFKDYEFNTLIDDEVDARLANLEETRKNGTVSEFLYAEQQMQAVPAMEESKTINAIAYGVANWNEYSQAGLSPLAFGDWNQFVVGGRAEGYSSSISLAENAFMEAEAKIKAASEEITGVDDSVSQSLDSIYDSLFGNDARPIKVMVVDIDGNLLGSTTTNQYSSNFDVEQNIGADIFRLMPTVKSNE